MSRCHTSNYDIFIIVIVLLLDIPLNLCSLSIPQYTSQLQSVHIDTPGRSTESHTGNNGTSVRKKNINLCFTSIMSSLHRMTQ